MLKINTNELAEETRSSPKGKFVGACVSSWAKTCWRRSDLAQMAPQPDRRPGAVGCRIERQAA